MAVTQKSWYRDPWTWLALLLISPVAVYCVAQLLGHSLDKLSASDWAAWVQALGSVGAIVAAAWVVQHQHVLEKRRVAEVQAKRRAERCNAAMFTLARQMNWALNYKSQFLDHNEKDPARHFHLLSSPPYDLSRWAVDTRALAFLAGTPAHDVLQDMVLADDKFDAAVQAVNARSHIHLHEFQPRMEQLGVNASSLFQVGQPS